MKLARRELGKARFATSVWSMVAIVTCAVALNFSMTARVGASTDDGRAAAITSESSAIHKTRVRRLTQHIGSRYSVPAPRARTIVETAFTKGTELGIAPELILAIIAVESTFREKVVSRAGARGLMQVIPKWHPKQVREIGGPRALFDPRKNIHAGSRILARYLRLSRGHMRTALLRYNGSLKNPRSRYADKVFRRYESLRQASSA